MAIKVLYVDDDSAISEIAKNTLERDPDIKVGTADSVERAKELMNQDNFDIIVSDYQMSEASGIDFLKYLRQKGNRIPFIIFTGRGREEVVIEALNLGADAYIQKGGKPEAQFADLLSAAKNLAEKSKSQRELQNTQNQMKNLLDSLPAYAFLKDLDGRYIAVNRIFCELVGKPENEIIGKTVDEFFPKELADNTKKEDEEVLRTGNPILIEARSLFKGKLIEVAIRKVPLRDSDGHITALASIAFDVSELKQIERAYQQQAQMLSDIFASVQDGLCVLDKDMTVLHENQAMQRIYPAINPPAIGKKCYFAYENKTSRCPDCHAWRAIEKGEVIRETVYRRNPDDNEENCIEIFHFPLMNPETNQSRGAILYLRDITGKHLSERALSEGDKFVSEIFSSIQDGISVLDSNLNIIRVNDAMERWYAHALPIVGKKCYEAYHGRSEPCKECPTRRTLGTGKPEYNVVPKTGPGGEVVGWLDLFSFPMRNPKTLEIEGVIEYVRDVSEREKMRLALERSQEQFVSIFDSIDEPIYVCDPESHELLFINQSLKEDFGGILGKKCYETLQGLDAPCSFCTNDKIFGENVGQPYIWEFQNLITKRWYRCTDRAIIWPDGRLVRYEMAVDITERKMTEERLTQANQKLGILGNITKHDTFNQLAAIDGYVDFIRNTCEDKSILRCLDRISSASSSIQKQFEFVTDYQNVGVGSPEWLNVSESFKRACTDFDLQNISIENEVKCLEIFADPMLAKVFHNLLDNSIKHGKRTSKISIRGIETDHGYRIIYTDDGVGFSPESKASLFKTKAGGKSGFGLYLINKILAITGLSMELDDMFINGAQLVIIVPLGKYRIRSKKSDASTK